MEAKRKNKKTILPRILHPYLTIVNFCLYNFRFLEPPKRKKRLNYQSQQIIMEKNPNLNE